MSSMEVRIDVKGMDSALKKAKTNIERFGNLYTTLLAYNTASGMCFNATLPLGKNRKSKVSEENPGKGLSAGTFPAPGAVLDRLSTN